MEIKSQSNINNLSENKTKVIKLIDGFAICPQTNYPIYIKDNQHLCPHKIGDECHAGWRGKINYKIEQSILCNTKNISTPSEEIKKNIARFEDKNDSTFSVEIIFLSIHFRISFAQALRNSYLEKRNYEEIFSGSTNGVIRLFLYLPALFYDVIKDI